VGDSRGLCEPMDAIFGGGNGMGERWDVDGELSADQIVTRPDSCGQEEVDRFTVFAVCTV